MKNWFNRLWFIPVLALAVLACEKDEDQVFLQVGSAPSLGLSASTLTLTEANADNPALTATVAAADYGFSAAAVNKLQFGVKGKNFAGATEIILNKLNRVFTTAEINSIAVNLGLPTGVAGDLEVRLKSELINAPTLFSTVANLKVTPYRVVIVYPTLYVPGSYQGWSPDRADILVSLRRNDNYEGFVNFPDANTEFKLTDAPNWNNGIFGDESGGSSGKIASPGENFKAADAGYYRMNVDLNGKTWSLLRTTWGAIGDATPNGWGGDTPLTYDPASKSWKATMALTQAEIKFRANSDWGINFGDTGADGSLEYGGDNIKVPSAGTYVVELILSNPAFYTYKLTKQ